MFFDKYFRIIDTNGMRKQTLRQYGFIAVLTLTLTFGWGGTVAAGSTQSNSSHYSVSEVQIGGNGSAQHVCSSGGNYCASEAAGDTVVGDASSASYSAKFGSFTTTVPVLEMIVAGGIQNVGVLQPSTTATVSDTIKIRSYQSNGYSLYITGASPSQGRHNLNTMTAGCPCTSQPGQEQFGINLARNTSPNLGAAPVQVPSGTFSFGTVNAGYDQSDHFKYSNGDAVANSTKSTGETDYTLSMVLNISAATPAGQYTGNFSAVVVPTY